MPTEPSDPNAFTGIETPQKIVNAHTSALASLREDRHHGALALTPLADAAVANDAVPSSARVPAAPGRPPRRRVLTHEEEVELSRRIECGERDALFSLLTAPASAGAFRALAEEVRNGRAVPSTLLRNAEEDADTPAAAQKLAKMIDRAASAAALSSRPTREESTRERRRRRRMRVALELAEARFERHVLSGIARDARGRGADERARRGFIRGMNESSRAQHEFVGANFGLVVTYARRFVGQGLDMHDLVQEGQLGL
ncbi:MAG TPA: sigma-70 factor domain-containing protein, partial [Polyangiaceae bacterium]